MIFWKEWRRLRGRVFALAGFYIVTILMVPFPNITNSVGILEIAVLFTAWGAGMLLIPSVLGMDAYVGERDEGTEEFLFSKPLPLGRLLVAKFGLRLLLTLIITGVVSLFLLFRLAAGGNPLYLGTPPFVVWSILADVLLSQILVLMVTMAVSMRAPYQSTALIVGGALGAVLAALPIVPALWRTAVLQSLWGTFWILLALTLLTAGLGVSLLTRRQVTGGRA